MSIEDGRKNKRVGIVDEQTGKLDFLIDPEYGQNIDFKQRFFGPRYDTDFAWASKQLGRMFMRGDFSDDPDQTRRGAEVTEEDKEYEFLESLCNAFPEYISHGTSVPVGGGTRHHFYAIKLHQISESNFEKAFRARLLNTREALIAHGLHNQISENELPIDWNPAEMTVEDWHAAKESSAPVLVMHSQIQGRRDYLSHIEDGRQYSYDDFGFYESRLTPQRVAEVAVKPLIHATSIVPLLQVFETGRFLSDRQLHDFLVAQGKDPRNPKDADLFKTATLAEDRSVGLDDYVFCTLGRPESRYGTVEIILKPDCVTDGSETFVTMSDYADIPLLARKDGDRIYRGQIRAGVYAYRDIARNPRVSEVKTKGLTTGAIDTIIFSTSEEHAMFVSKFPDAARNLTLKVRPDRERLIEGLGLSGHEDDLKNSIPLERLIGMAQDAIISGKMTKEDLFGIADPDIRYELADKEYVAQRRIDFIRSELNWGSRERTRAIDEVAAEDCVDIYLPANFPDEFLSFITPGSNALHLRPRLVEQWNKDHSNREKIFLQNPSEFKKPEWNPNEKLLQIRVLKNEWAEMENWLKQRKGQRFFESYRILNADVQTK